MSMLGSGIYSYDYEVPGECENCQEDTTFTILINDYGTGEAQCHSCDHTTPLDRDPRKGRYHDEY